MATNRHSDNLAIWSHITSSLLASWINDKNIPNELLIIDSRDTEEYEQSHIKNSINLRNSKIMRKRLRSEKLSIIELLLRNTPFGLIENKHNINIVVYDAQSEHTNQLDVDKSFAFILLQKLAQKYKNVSFLTGGFANFKLEQPSLVQSFHNLSSYSPSSSSNSTILNTDVSFSSTCTSSTTTPISIFPFSDFETLTPPILKKNEMPSLISVAADSISTPKSENTRKPLLSKTTMRPSLNSSISSFNLITDATDKSKKIELTKEFTNEPPLTSVSTSSLLGEKIEEEENLIRHPTKILDFLYLGSQEDALSEPTMKALNITNVLNVSISCPKACFIGEENFLRIPVNDGHVAKISPFFDIAFRFIEKCRKANTNVLIHCLAGISRSPTLAIAYLMKFQSLKSDEAYKFVKERRPTISPNFNFLGQLYEYEKQQETCKKLNETSNVINQSETSNAPGLAFLKFTKKASFSATTEAADTTSKQNIDLERRPRRFIFRFNDTPLSNDLQLPSPSQAFSNFNLNSPTASLNPSISNQTITGSPTITDYPLKSFSKQTFSNNEIPKCLGVFVPKSFTVNSLKDLHREPIEIKDDEEKNKTDSNSINDKLFSGVVLRRPNMLVMNSNSNRKILEENDEKNQHHTMKSSKSINTLKRPSSILGFSRPNFLPSSPLKSPQQIEPHLQKEQIDQQQNHEQSSSLPFVAHNHVNFPLKDRKFVGTIGNDLSSPTASSSTQYSISSASSTSTITPIIRTLSNTSASSSSSSCSCCSNVSSSSNSVSSFNQASPYVCNSCASQQFVNHFGTKQQQQQDQQYQCQKKIKLSPIKDKFNFLSSFGTMTTNNKQLDSPANVFKPNFIQMQSVTIPTSTPFPSSTASHISFGDITQHHSTATNNMSDTFISKPLSSCNTQSLFSNEFHQNDSNNQGASANAILNIKQEQMNESKSFETYKSLMDQNSIQRNKARRRSRNYEEDENFNSENDDENHRHSQRLMVSLSEERILSNSSSLINLSSIQNSKTTCSATNSANAIQTKSSSSSSSSKNGSNRNSLHGSIETMIEVS